MSEKLAQALNAVHPQMLRASSEGSRNGSETKQQELGKRMVGRWITVALERSGLSKQEAAYTMGYTDSSVIGRWISGIENAQFARLCGLGPRFRQELIVAMAEDTPDIDISMQITVRRTA